MGNQLTKLGNYAIGPRYMRRYKWYEEDMAERHIVEPHWYLQFVGVHPDCQGRGLGNALVQHLKTLAKGNRVGCYLETDTEKNVEFYLSQGYDILSDKPVNKLPELKVWTMYRPADRR